LHPERKKVFLTIRGTAAIRNTTMIAFGKELKA